MSLRRDAARDADGHLGRAAPRCARASAAPSCACALRPLRLRLRGPGATQQDYGKRYGGRYGSLLPVTLAEVTETLRSP
eukprot:7091321-Prymnesium_polylepis.2